MKKLLALVLALVMVMGLAAVGTNAAYIDDKYTDVDDINYDEAVAVMSAVGVLEGADNQFRPGVELKRSEAAKIVAYLNTNNKTAEGLVGVGKWSDVPTNHWAAGYIDYLTSINVLAGRDASTFDPDGALTAVDFAKMLLVVLGFDPKIEGLVGNDYKINTTKLAQDEKLFKGLGSDLNVNDVLTREQAAQMAFNAVKAPTVEYSNKGGSISVNGAEINLGASGYNYVTTTIASAQNIYSDTLTSYDVNASSGYIVEFGERQYPTLVLNDNALDPFGRPCSEWIYGKQEVGTFINKDLLEASYTTAITGADLFELLGESRIKRSDIVYKVNGKLVEYIDPVNDLPDGTNKYVDWIKTHATEAYRTYGIAASNMIRGNKIPYAMTGNGVLTEVYEKRNEIIIVSIYTYYAEAAANYNQRNDELKLETVAFDGDNKESTVLDGNNPAPLFLPGKTFPLVVSGDDIPETTDITKYKESDRLLVRVAWDSDTSKFVVREVYDPKNVAEGVTVTKFSTKTIGQATGIVTTGLFYEGYIVTGGETQAYSKAVNPAGLESYASGKIDGTFNVVYDLYDYVIHTEKTSSVKNYVFIAGVDNFTSNLGTTTADAFAIFANGDSATIKVNVSKTDEEIEKYTAARAGKSTTKSGKEVDPYKYNGVKVDDDYSVNYLEMGNELPLHAYNRWFTYSVSGEGANAVYSLKPAGNSLMTGGYGAKYTGMNPQSKDNRPVISAKSTRMVGDYADYRTDISAATPIAEHVAWGNDNTVYITVETAQVSSKKYTEGKEFEAYQTSDDVNKDYKRGIAKVTGTYVGIENVDLVAYEQGGASATKNPFNEAFYAVYSDDDDRYAIAVVALATEKGDDGSYVYAISKAGSQWKDGSYDYWDINVIKDGELTTMTVKDKYGDLKTTIENAISFKPSGTNAAVGGGMLKVTLDKDGNITNAEPVYYDAGSKTAARTDSDNKIFANQDLGQTDKKRTIDDEKLYQTYFANNDTYYAIGRTLYNQFNMTGKVTSGDYVTGTDIGLRVASGAPIFVLQEERLKASGDFVPTVTEFSNFREALGHIADATWQTQGLVDETVFNGFVSAVLSNGSAKWIVLKNTATKLDYENNKGTTATPTPDATKKITVSSYVTATGFTVTLSNFDSGNYVIEMWETATTDKPVSIYPVTVSGNSFSITVGNNKSSATWKDNTNVAAGKKLFFTVKGVDNLMSGVVEPQ